MNNNNNNLYNREFKKLFCSTAFFVEELNENMQKSVN